MKIKNITIVYHRYEAKNMLNARHRNRLFIIKINKRLNAEEIMVNASIERNKLTNGNVKIVFEFPPQSYKDEEIKMEVKSIMANVLREHLLLQKTS